MEEMKDKLNIQGPLKEAYFNCMIKHLYGSEWDGVWDCDFKIDTYKITVEFCTKYWLFSEYLELSWDQFIDGKFYVIGGKLYYENQSLTMDAEMLPNIEAAQDELKEIRKQYAVLKIKPDGKKQRRPLLGRDNRQRKHTAIA